jgi:hypothetical protein
MGRKGHCRDQIMKSLTREFGLDIETKYLWELVADSLIVELWSEEEVEKPRFIAGFFISSPWAGV